MKAITVKINVNFELLREQKKALQRHINSADDGSLDKDRLEGLLCLIDYIQDTAVGSGQCTEEEVFGNLEVT